MASPSVVSVDIYTVRLAFVVLQGVKASDEQFSGHKNCRYVQLVRIFHLKKCYERTIGQLNSTNICTRLFSSVASNLFCNLLEIEALPVFSYISLSRIPNNLQLLAM